MKILKKIGLAFIAFAASVALLVVPANTKKVEAANAIPVAGGFAFGPSDGFKRVYFSPGTSWKAEEGWYAIYMFNSSSNIWIAMQQTNSIFVNDNDNIWYADIDENYPNIIFTCMNKDSTALDWNNKVRQSADYLLADYANRLAILWDDAGYSGDVVKSKELMQFNVNFEIEEDATISSSSTKLNSGESFASLDSNFIPVRTGYDFTGWVFEDGTRANTFNIYSTTTLKASWEAWTVSSVDVTFFNGEDVAIVKTIPQGSTVAEHKIVNPGYELEWRLLDGTLFDFHQPIEESLSLYASWTYNGLAPTSLKRYYFDSNNINTNEWEDIYCYAFDSRDNKPLGGWPGTKLDQFEKLWYIDLPFDSDVKYIFNSPGHGESYAYNLPATGANIFVPSYWSEGTDKVWRVNLDFLTNSPAEANDTYKLDVGMQLANNGSEDTADVRFLSKLDLQEEDLADVSTVGFTFIDPVTEKSKIVLIDKVYQTVVIDGVEVKASDNGSNFIFTIVIRNVPDQSQFVVTPFAITNDGATIFGVTKAFIVIAAHA